MPPFRVLRVGACPERSRGVVLFILLATAFSAQSKILFHSNFENERTYTATALQPGAKKIELLPSPEIEQWFPETGGEVIIEPNYPKNREVLQYSRRKGHVLYLEKATIKPHPQHASVRVGSLCEWFDEERLIEHFTNSRITVHRKQPLAGSHSAQIACDSEITAQLPARIDPVKSQKVYTRFLLRLSHDFAVTPKSPFPVFRAGIDNLLLPSLNLVAHELERVFTMEFVAGPAGKAVQHFENEPVALFADTAHCIEIGMEQTADNQVKCSLWVDGQFSAALRSVQNPQPKNSTNFTFGKSSTARHSGYLQLDEIIISNSPVGVLPPKPELAYSQQGGTIGVREQPPTAAAVQWQIAATNSWLLPDFNSGLDRNNLAGLPDLHFLFLPYSVFYAHKARETAKIPLGLRPGSSFARCRWMNAQGTWGDWSQPVPLAISPATDLTARTKHHQLDAWFTAPGNRERQNQIEPGRWYDLHGRFSPRGSYCFCDIYLTGTPETFLGNHGNRGEPFRSRDNYAISLDFYKRTLWTRQQEGSKSSTMLIGQKGLYCDDTKGKTLYGIEDGKMRIRFRLLPQALPGPWALKAFFADSQYVSPLMRTMFQVKELSEAFSQPDRTTPSGNMIALAVIVVGFFVAGLLWIRKIRLRKQHLPGQPHRAVELRLEAGQSSTLHAANQYMLAHYHEPITVNDVAKAIGVSRNWLSKFFKPETGKSASQYLNELRIEKAKELLLEPGRHSGEIAFEVGFKTIGHFNWTFRQITGMSPSVYREKAKSSR